MSNPNSSPVAILGVSEKTIDELDVTGVLLESFTEDSMTFTIHHSIPDNHIDRLKTIIKNRVGQQCRIMYSPSTGRPDYLILKRLYLT
jgi:hypothetical protein